MKTNWSIRISGASEWKRFSRQIATLQTIPGLGEKKSRKLLETASLSSLVAISNASVADLSKVVDVSAARAVHDFFNMHTNA
jgi:excinuclease UvrABC nuclease subunit